METSNRLRLRFATVEQLDKMKRLDMPALLLPLGMRADKEANWVFHSNTGPIPAPGPETLEELMKEIHSAGLTWRFVPGGLALVIEPPPNAIAALQPLQDWLTETGYPFDYLDIPAAQER